MVLPSSLLASVPASPLSSRFLACNSVFISSKRFLLSEVARSALPRGNTKLGAKPSFTRTTSALCPSLPTRSSRITSIVVTPQFDLWLDGFSCSGTGWGSTFCGYASSQSDCRFDQPEQTEGQH